MVDKIVFLVLHVLTYGLTTYLRLRNEKDVTALLNGEKGKNLETISN